MTEENQIPHGYCHCGCGRNTWVSTTTNADKGYVKGQPSRYCHGHNQIGRSLAERVWPRVNKDGPSPTYKPELGSCWLWEGGIGGKGYGIVGRNSGLAHRAIYELVKGKIPDGLQLDHLCRVRSCVNPDHLEPVTARTNILRGVANAAINAAKTHCPQGHPLSGDNLEKSQLRYGWRSCLICAKENKRKHNLKRQLGAKIIRALLVAY